MNKPRQERTIGDTYERTIKGIVYLVEYTGVRKNRIVSRITPYSCPQRANNRGNATTKNIKQKSGNPDALPNMLKLKGSGKIFIAENSRTVTGTTKINKGYIIHHSKTA